MNPGDRVRVSIGPNALHRWSKPEHFQGVEGVVSEVKREHWNGQHAVTLRDPSVLVAFDPPLPPSWRWGSEISGHWFDASELEVVP